MECIVCKNRDSKEIYTVKERMLNNGEQFEYIRCPECGTLRIAQPPADMSDYYGNSYYSFSASQDIKKSLGGGIKKILRKAAARIYLSGCWCPYEMKSMEVLKPIKNATQKKILDVGCGDGRWLKRLEDRGFKAENLYGIDLYCPERKDEKILLRKGEVFDIEKEKYDIITLHHAFEHMFQPVKVLKKIKCLLNDEGVIIIRIPVMGKELWRKYKENWFQIDAPRHICLYTEKAMEILCQQAGLEITERKCDGYARAYIISEMYRDSTLSLNEIQEKLDNTKIDKKYTAMVRKANKDLDGDQMIFWIRVKENSEN